jgi:hypothetical protein
MNKPSRPKENSSSVGWWVGWIALTIITFFISCYFWTGLIARHVGPMQKPGVPVLWIAAVFGSWMLLLVPLIILMYNKVDRAYEDARIERESSDNQKKKSLLGVRCVSLEEPGRLLPKPIREKLKNYPETIRHGHLVHATLKDGRKIKNVFILKRKEVLGVYDVDRLTFQIEEIVGVEPASLDEAPNFTEDKWLRLDGVGNPV